MLTLHRAERTDILADALGELLTAPLDDPFARDIVAVPARGIERWLTQRLSTVLGATHGDGVAANIDFPSPSRLVAEVLAAASDTTAEDDPWLHSRVLWTVLDVIDDSVGEPWCAALARHLGHGADDHRAGRRYATAAHLADLLRSLRTAASGHDRRVGGRTGHRRNGRPARRPPPLAGRTVASRARPHRHRQPVPATRHLCARLRAEPEIVGLPGRVSLFGPTRLDAVQLAVVSALAAHRDVHLWVPHPSPAMWTALRGRKDSAVSRRGRQRARVSVTRCSQRSDATCASSKGGCRASRPPRSPTRPPSRPPRCSAECSRDIRADRAPEPGSAQADGTVMIHACHGPTRQVEVLRECLLHLFQDDPDPRAARCGRDVPGRRDLRPARARRVRAGSGRAPRAHAAGATRRSWAAPDQSGPVGRSTTLLGLADARVTASEVLDLAAAAPVRRRFGFDDDDLERLQEWAPRPEHAGDSARGNADPFGLADFPQNTFGTALDRILLGVAADESGGEWLSLALPLDDVDSNDIDLAGRFAEYIDRLTVSLLGIRGPHPAEKWSAALVQALDLLIDVAPADAWQLAQAHREIGAAVEHAGGARTAAGRRARDAREPPGRAPDPSQLPHR